MNSYVYKSVEKVVITCWGGHLSDYYLIFLCHSCMISLDVEACHVVNHSILVWLMFREILLSFPHLKTQNSHSKHYGSQHSWQASTSRETNNTLNWQLKASSRPLKMYFWGDRLRVTGVWTTCVRLKMLICHNADSLNLSFFCDTVRENIDFTSQKFSKFLEVYEKLLCTSFLFMWTGNIVQHLWIIPDCSDFCWNETVTCDFQCLVRVSKMKRKHGTPLALVMLSRC